MNAVGAVDAVDKVDEVDVRIRKAQWMRKAR